jgi:glycosyltransferase involved in cell wall biosynthesis
MKVVFDHQIFCIQHVGGISRYFSNLIQYINTPHSGIAGELLVKYTDNVYLKNTRPGIGSVPRWLSKNFIGKKFILERINRYYTNRWLKQNDFDVFFPTYYDTYFEGKINKPYVLTVHDMTHEYFPALFLKNRDFTLGKKRKAINHAAHLIAISENTKKDLLKFYDVPQDKITVVHHGMEPTYTTQQVAGLPACYFLFVGERGMYKNFEVVARALGALQNSSVELICTGKPFAAAEMKLLNECGLAARATAMQVTDAQLNFLYEKSAALVYPSLYEGFGYPLLEAMRANCPVISADSSCLPEVGGNAALYFNPNNAEELKNKMLQVLSLSEKDKAELVAKGRENLARFTMKESMEKTIAILKKVAAAKI